MEKKFTVEVQMEERWIPHFMSMLKHMEMLGGIGSSRELSFYADGDGDFRPKFKTDVDFEIVKPDSNNQYDAG